MEPKDETRANSSVKQRLILSESEVKKTGTMFLRRNMLQIQLKQDGEKNIK